MAGPAALLSNDLLERVVAMGTVWIEDDVELLMLLAAGPTLNCQSDTQQNTNATRFYSIHIKKTAQCFQNGKDDDTMNKHVFLAKRDFLNVFLTVDLLNCVIVIACNARVYS